MVNLKTIRENLNLPVIGAPLFIISNPKLVIAQCIAGVIGSFPALNARPIEMLDEWLDEIDGELKRAKKESPFKQIAPYAVNQIIHQSNKRLDHDLDLCAKYKVPIIITSLSEPGEIVSYVHSYGGVVFHDVISARHAQKAIEVGVDGLILVASGAGGHAGRLSPFAIVREVRQFFKGPIALSGAITDGAGILAAEAIGADFAYMGTRFIATTEANAVEDYKDMILDSSAKDIVYTPFFTGVHGNYLAKSIVASGLDPDDLESGDKSLMDFGEERKRLKTWKDIWGAGQGVGNIKEVINTSELVKLLICEYETERKRVAI